VSQASPAGAIKVLVIDDSNTIRRSAELFLRQAGYEVILAEDGFDALSKISDHQPQVIFVDIMMRGSMGIRLARSSSRTRSSNPRP